MSPELIEQYRTLGKLEAIEKVYELVSAMPERARAQGSKQIDEVAEALGIEKALTIIVRYGNEIAQNELKEIKK